MVEISLIKGSISWNKASGIIQASGLVPPGNYGDNLSVGDFVNIKASTIYTSPALELREWRCVPNGWVFSARNSPVKDLIGEYKSIFKCLSRYKSLITDQDVEDFLNTLALYDAHNIRETSSPYADDTSTGWWKLSDIIEWSIPSMADAHISSLTATSFSNQIGVINSYVPLINILFLPDAFNRVISIIDELSTISEDSTNISISSYIDWTDVDNVDLLGSKGNPKKDPRTTGPGKVSFGVKETIDDDKDSILIEIEERFTHNVWFTDSSKSYQENTDYIWTLVGSRPLQIDSALDSYIRSLVVTTNLTDIWGKIINLMFDKSLAYFELFIDDIAIKRITNYTFNSCFPGISPLTHMSPLINRNLHATVISNDNVVQNFLGEIGYTTAYIDPSVFTFEQNAIAGLTSVDDTGTNKIASDSSTWSEFNSAQYRMAKYSKTNYEYEVLCSGTSAESDEVPYLFRQKKVINKNYQAGPFILDLDSRFWLVPGAEKDLNAVDNTGRKVWLGPFDNQKAYAYGLSTMSILYELYNEYSGSEDLYETLCLVSFMGYFLKESDIVIAAICDELQQDSPQAYQRHFDEYFSTVNEWFMGQWTRLNGLRHTIAGSHKGLTTALNAISKKYGDSKMTEIFERILPGTKIEDLHDGAGRSYCLDMLRWINQHGAIRLAMFSPDDTTDAGFVRQTAPLLESTVISSINNGQREVKTINEITKDISLVQTPVSGHPEYVYIPPRYVQLSTLTGAGTATSISNKILQTKVMDWSRLSMLKEKCQSLLVGKKILMVSSTIDYSDNATMVPTVIADALSTITVRNCKLSISGDCNLLISTNYLAYAASKGD